MKIKKKNQKPIEIDAHLKYRCPNPSCGYDHWLNLIESQTKNFKVVCYCGQIFKPKQIDKIKIKYCITNKKQTKKEQTQTEPIESIQQPAPVTVTQKPISERLLFICSRTLMNYGFTKSEAHELLKQSYILNPTEQPLELMNNTLIMIGKINDTDNKTN